MTWLSDSVFSIREAATNNLKELTIIFGAKWAIDNLIPKVLALKDNSNYLYRMTTLFATSVSIRKQQHNSKKRFWFLLFLLM